MKESTRQVYEFEDFRLDAGRGVLFRGNELVSLTPKAIEILRMLIEGRGELVSKEEIFDEVWADSFIEEANLSHHISRLRKALEGDGQRKLIETVPKRGYRFVGQLREPDPGRDPHTSNERRLAWIWIVPVVLLAAGGIAWYLSSRVPAPRAGSPELKASSLAVLPLINESGDEEIDYLADGLTESLIARLSGTPALRVRPHSVVSRYKTASDPAAIGKELNVGFLLSGRLTKRGDSVRLFLSLVDVASGYQIWGRQYERDVGSLAVLQSEIVRDVSEYLPGKLLGPGTDRILSGTTQSSQAYLLYLKGRYQLNRKTEDGLRKAIELFREAAALDPSYALAHSGIADAYNQMGLWVRVPPSETFPKARSAAEHALSFDDKLAEARAALAFSKFYYDWDFAGAERDFQRAVQDNPDYVFAREMYAVLIYETDPGRFDEAVRQLDAATAVDPVALAPYFWRAAFYYFEGKHDLALNELAEVQNIDPNFTLGLALKGAVYREKGDYKNYLDHWLNASTLEGVDLSDAEIRDLRVAYAAGGARAYEVAYAELLQQKAEVKYVSPLFVAMHYSLAGETEDAFQWLEKAFAERSSWLVELRVDPAWKNIRKDPRFDDLIKRIGFPQ